MSEDTEKYIHAAKILRSMTDVRDKYIMDAAAFGEKKESGRKNKILDFRRWGGIAVAAAACFAVAVVGTYVANLNSGTLQTGTGESYEMDANPYEEVGSLAEAEAITGFSFTVPEAEAPYDNMLITVIDGEMTEVSYYNDDMTDLGYYVRKAKGDDDISGDYSEYEQVETETIGDIKVTMKGNNGNWSVATWTSNGYTYAVGAQNHPLTEEMLATIVTEMN